MGKIAIVFAGQGAQYPGMGREIAEFSASAKSVFDMGERIKKGVCELCFNGDKQTLTLTEHTQPCLYLTDLACAYALREHGVLADVAAGFSLGEIPALAYAGVLSDEDGFRLVILRGEAMAECAAKHRGGMAAVLRLDAETVERLCIQCGVYPVNYNCKGQIVCAGEEQGIADLLAAVKTVGGRGIKLAVSGAFHTPYMAGAQQALEEALMSMDVNPPRMPLYSNRTAEPYPEDRAQIVDLIASQCANGVKWEQSVINMAACGVDTFIEVGAGTTLGGLISKIVPTAKIYNVGDAVSLQKTVAAIKGAADV